MESYSKEESSIQVPLQWRSPTLRRISQFLLLCVCRMCISSGCWSVAGSTSSNASAASAPPHRSSFGPRNLRIGPSSWGAELCNRGEGLMLVSYCLQNYKNLRFVEIAHFLDQVRSLCPGCVCHTLLHNVRSKFVLRHNENPTLHNSNQLWLVVRLSVLCK